MAFIAILSAIILVLLPAPLTGCSLSKTVEATDSWQTISSPNYPNDYQGNENRCWNIVSSVDNLLFEVISYDLETDHDYLRIYDTSEEGSLEIEHYTGEGEGRVHATLTSSISVQFTSDESVAGSGFQMRFKSYTPDADGNFIQKSDDGDEQGVSTELRSSSSTTWLYASSGWSYFNSPNYPNYYNNDELCYWRIRSDFYTGVELYAVAFSTESSDIVYVYDGYSTSSTLYAQYSGASVAGSTVYSSGNYLFVKWDSDGTSQYLPGFQFSYRLASGYRSTSTYNASASAVVIAGAVIGALVGAGFIIFAIIKCVQQNKRRSGGGVTVYSTRNTIKPAPVAAPQPTTGTSVQITSTQSSAATAGNMSSAQVMPAPPPYQPVAPPAPVAQPVAPPAPVMPAPAAQPVDNTGGTGDVPAAPTYLSAQEVAAVNANMSAVNVPAVQPPTTDHSGPAMPAPPTQPGMPIYPPPVMPGAYQPTYPSAPPPPSYAAHIQY